MKVTFLGTGTSQGIPVIGCDCRVCQSTDPRDNRLRTSALISDQNINIAIDAGPDFRQQMLRAKVSELEAILLTHEHNDHVVGMDDVRPFNFRSRRHMPIFATTQVQEQLKLRFPYIFDEDPYPGAPRLELKTITAGVAFNIGSFHILPIEVMHGALPVLGFRFGDFTYITDAKTISPENLERIAGTRILVLNALHHSVHYSHLNLKEALDMIAILKPEQTYLTHISHSMGLAREIETQLPIGVHLAYDGLELEI